MPGRAALNLHLVETVAHTWDLAKATGQQPKGPPGRHAFRPARPSAGRSLRARPPRRVPGTHAVRTRGDPRPHQSIDDRAGVAAHRGRLPAAC
jgi:hypothetical protein